MRSGIGSQGKLTKCVKCVILLLCVSVLSYVTITGFSNAFGTTVRYSSTPKTGHSISARPGPSFSRKPGNNSASPARSLSASTWQPSSKRSEELLSQNVGYSFIRSEEDTFTPSRGESKTISTSSARYTSTPFWSVSSTNKGLEKKAFDNGVSEKPVQGKLTPVAGFGSDILLYTAIVGNSTNTTAWDKISVQGWQAARLANVKLSFCVRHRSGFIQRYNNVTRYQSRFAHKNKCIAVQFICRLKKNYGNDPPEFVTLTNKTGSNVCESISKSSFLKASFAYRHPGEIAVFAKVVYGNVSTESLLSWFEIHKLFGFSKVYIYPLELNSTAMKVLQHYEEEGKVEMIPFTMPQTDNKPPVEILKSGKSRVWNDKIVTLFDGLERLRGYDYVVAFDFDEYLIPKTAKTWRSLFDTEFRRDFLRSGYAFYTYLHLKDWGSSSNTSQFDVVRYLRRTGPTTDRIKHVIVPDRVADASLETHRFLPKKGFGDARMMSSTLAGIHHFRSCRKDWIKRNSTLLCDARRIYDEKVYTLFKKVEAKIMELKQRLGV